MQQIAYITGMHCASCDLIIRETVKKTPGITLIDITAEGVLTYDTDTPDASEQLYTALRTAGYQVSDRRIITSKKINVKEIILIAIFAVGLWLLLSRVDITGYVDGFGSGGSRGYTEMLFVGFIASLSTCLALVGGFILMRGSLQRPSVFSLAETVRQQSLFQGGRLLGYALGGALLGRLGSGLVYSSTMNGMINIVISALLLIMGRNMLGRFQIRLPMRGGSQKVMDLLNVFTTKKRGGILVGALTFLLPCGFTQMAQIAALNTGDPLEGALLLVSFALGTLPVLLILGITGQRFQINQNHLSYKLLGTTLMVLALFLFSNASRLLGW